MGDSHDHNESHPDYLDYMAECGQLSFLGEPLATRFLRDSYTAVDITEMEPPPEPMSWQDYEDLPHAPPGRSQRSFVSFVGSPVHASPRKSGGVMGGWKNASQVDTTWLRAFLYGPLGSGKTKTVATFPTPVLILPPSEGSVTTIQGLDIPFYVVGEDKPALIEQDLRGVLEQLAAADAKGTLHTDFGETIVVENLSHLCDSLISAWTQGGRVPADQRTWGQLRTTMMYMRDVLFRLKAHVVFTALDKVTTDQSGSITFAGPRISGAAAELLPSSCDLVGVCEQVNSNPPRWQVHFRNYGAFKGRSRLASMKQGGETMIAGDGEKHPTIFQQLAVHLPQYQERPSEADIPI